MKTLLLLCALLLAFGPTAPAEEVTELATLDGEHFRGVTVTATDATSVSFRHEGGASTLPFTRFPVATREKLGYDPAKAAEAIRAENIQAESQRRIAEQKAQLRTEAAIRLAGADDADRKLAAFAFAVLEKRRQRPFEMDDWQFLGEDLRRAIRLYVPDLAPGAMSLTSDFTAAPAMVGQ